CKSPTIMTSYRFLTLLLLGWCLGAHGQSPLWIRTFGSEFSDGGIDHEIDTDDAGNSYVTVISQPNYSFRENGTLQTIFDPQVPGGHRLIKFDPSGVPEWGRSWDVGDDARFLKLATAKDGHCYVAGVFTDATADLDPGPGTAVFPGEAREGNPEIYFSRFDKDGNTLWVKTIRYHQYGGVPYGEMITGLEVDADQNIYLTGFINDTLDFDPSANDAIFHASTGNVKHYLAKYDRDGNYQWAFTLDADLIVLSRPILALDAMGRPMLYGGMFGTVDFDPSASEFLLDGNNGVRFVARYDGDGQFLAAFNLPALFIQQLVPDQSGGFFLSGNFRDDIDMDPSANDHILTAATNIVDPDPINPFLARYDANTDLLWAFNFAMKAGGDDAPRVIANNQDTLILIGSASGEWDIDPSPADTVLEVGEFIARFDPNGNFVDVYSDTRIAFSLRGVAVDAQNNIHISGAAYPDEDLDIFTDGVATIDPLFGDGSDLFVAAYPGNGFVLDALTTPTLPSGTVKVFPNPGRDRVRVLRQGVHPAEATVYVTDLQGRSMRVPTPWSAHQKTYDMDVSQWTPGVYIIRVTSASDSHTHRLVVGR
ncbi:MAG: T9SS type A sorting domain-containing protein, partial [Bacteroidota bacterium]